ncbi:collagen binding domain-containing protein, partial [Anaerobacillus sp. 1_MG-2023]
KPGNYQFVETQPAFGYELNSTPIPFTIEKGQDGVTKVVATNKLTPGAVELVKVDSEDATLYLENAVFE